MGVGRGGKRGVRAARGRVPVPPSQPASQSPARLQVNEAAHGPGALLGEGSDMVLRVTTPESPLTGTWGKSPISTSVFLMRQALMGPSSPPQIPPEETGGYTSGAETRGEQG